jgi:hypothetical protein
VQRIVRGAYGVRSRVPAWAWRGLAAALVVVIAAFYLGGAARQGASGYPLDDGWIHQTYARNLAQTGRFVYTGNATSAGSTSPLWTGMLSIAYLLGLPPLGWSYLLGGAFWLLTGWATAQLTRRLYPQRPSLAPWVGAACLVEWHLAWASFSGMETTLFAFLTVLLIERYAAGAHPALLGALGGVAFLARPEGAGLLLLVGVASMVEMLWLSGQRGRARWATLGRRIGGMALGAALVLAPYLALSWARTGQLLPDTFYAKQAEYGALLSQPLWARLWRVVRRPLIGGQVLLLPGFAWAAVSCLRLRREGAGESRRAALVRLLPLAWWAAYLVTYALRMPVDYQYGRYLMPTIPFLLLYGVVGTARWLRIRSVRMIERALSRAAIGAAACLFVAFLAIGQQAYASDVRLIDCEMVRVAQWLAAETPPSALVAAHDIGAIGYYSGRSLIDLAGLVTPEVIPVMRDEPQLAQFVVDAGADYLVTFPSWYPWITQQAAFVKVYQTACALTRERGGDNMAVYAIRR